jgi:hypothetical protein
MIVSIHWLQNLLWLGLGYPNRIAEADKFIVLEHVEFERRNYHNRSGIALDGPPFRADPCFDVARTLAPAG